MGRGEKVRPCFSCDHGSWTLPITPRSRLTGCPPSQSKSTLATPPRLTRHRVWSPGAEWPAATLSVPPQSPHVKTQWLNEDESVGLWLTSSWGAGSFLPQAPAFPRGTPSRDPPQGPPGLHGTVESTQGGRWFPTRVSGFTDHEAALAMGEATEGGFLKLLSGPASAVGLLCGLNSAES